MPTVTRCHCQRQLQAQSWAAARRGSCRRRAWPGAATLPLAAQLLSALAASVRTRWHSYAMPACQTRAPVSALPALGSCCCADSSPVPLAPAAALKRDCMAHVHARLATKEAVQAQARCNREQACWCLQRPRWRLRQAYLATALAAATRTRLSAPRAPVHPPRAAACAGSGPLLLHRVSVPASVAQMARVRYPAALRLPRAVLRM